MNPKFKLLLYAVLVACLGALAFGFHSAYHGMDGATASTAAGAGATNNALTNAALATNSAAATNTANTTNATNTAIAVAGTNGTNASVTSQAAVKGEEDELPNRRRSPRMGRLMAFGAAMFFNVVILAILIGHDLSRFLANRVENFIFNPNLEGVKDPEYEEAEQIWASGDHLEAIRLMREYLKRHPREQYVALRIAEIYENDLRNHLAAALEYEEVLKKKLPPERWGWTAIHLANIYSGKLNRTAEATALLRRIAEQYAETGAAKKARERLGIPEPVAAPAQAPAVVGSAPESEKPAPPASNLPPGFRPK